MFKRRFYVLQNEAGDAGAAGGGASMGDAGAAAGGGAGQAGQGGGNGAPAGAGGESVSVLASGAAAAGGGAGAAGAAGGAADPNAWLPAKHRVFGEDGKTLNLEASARKVAEAYGHAEKRIGIGDLPPKSADDYKVNVPQALAEKIKTEDLAGNAGFKEFLGKAHAAGLTQAQVDVVVGDFLERSLAVQSGMKQLTEQEATAALKETWKSDQEYKTNVQAAFRAGQAYGDIDKLMDKYGNDPDFIRFAANVGKELSEDTGAAAGARVTQEDVEALARSEAYLNPRHPDHLVTKQRVEAGFQRLHGDAPKKPGTIVINT